MMSEVYRFTKTCECGKHHETGPLRNGETEKYTCECGREQEAGFVMPPESKFFARRPELERKP